MSTTDDTPQRKWVESGKKGQVTGFRLPRFEYTVLGMFLLYRLIHNRDCKIIITSSGSTTGTGKTTLAIHICRWVREVSNLLFGADHEWNAEDDAFVDVYDYLNAYRESDPGDALLMDEIEYAADRRRFASHQNVNLSQAWSILRYKNVVSVATLPTVTMLDFRLMELADVWINVQKRGKAYPYYLTVNDFSGDLIRKRFTRWGFKESIKWHSLDDDEDFEILTEKKANLGVPGMDDSDVYQESDLNEAERQLKREVAKTLLELKEAGDHTMPQHMIGKVAGGLDQSTVSKIKREELA